MLYVYQFMTLRFKKAYLRDLSSVEKLLTNSKNTQKRIKFFTGREAHILYPPVDTDFFSPKKDGEKIVEEEEYYLSFARLSSIKRVDKIVSAFQKMPNRKLVITYGANDPERQKIMSMVHGHTNIEMRLSPSDHELRYLIQ